MRVFVPATLPLLRTLRNGGLTAPLAAHAVTGPLRELSRLVLRQETDRGRAHGR